MYAGIQKQMVDLLTQQRPPKEPKQPSRAKSSWHRFCNNLQAFGDDLPAHEFQSFSRELRNLQRKYEDRTELVRESSAAASGASVHSQHSVHSVHSNDSVLSNPPTVQRMQNVLDWKAQPEVSNVATSDPQQLMLICTSAATTSTPTTINDRPVLTTTSDPMLCAGNPLSVSSSIDYTSTPIRNLLDGIKSNNIDLDTPSHDATDNTPSM